MKRLLFGCIVLAAFTINVSYSHAAFLRQQGLTFPGIDSTTGLHGITLFNPSWINHLEQPVLSGKYHRLFGLSELPENRLFAGMPSRWGQIGIGAVQFGTELYSEENISIIFGRKFIERGAFGLSLNYHQLSIQNYGSASAISADIGGHWFITEQITWELSYSNLNQAVIGKSLEPIPQHFFTGFTYRISQDLLTRLFILHDLEMAPRYGLHTSYHLFSWLQADLIAVTDPVRVNPHLILQWKLIGIAYGLATHPDLPYTHNFGLTLRF